MTDSLVIISSLFDIGCLFFLCILYIYFPLASHISVILLAITNFVFCVPQASLLQISETNHTASASMLDNAFWYTAILGTCYITHL